MVEKPNSIILTADDFSETGMLAVGHALRMGRLGNAEVHIVHVLTEKELDAATGVTRLEKQNALLGQVPAQLWDRVGQAGGTIADLRAMRVHVHVRIGVPSEAINRTAADYDVDIIVVGTSGRRGVERLILGSVAESLVKSANCPVLVVRPKDYSRQSESEHPEPARPGEDLHAERPRESHVYTSSQLMSWTTRDVDALGPKM